MYLHAKESIIEVKVHCTVDLDIIVKNTDSLQEKVGNQLCLNRPVYLAYSHLYSGRVLKTDFKLDFMLYRGQF